MNRQWTTLILLACVALLAGCGSSNQPSNPSPNAVSSPGSSTSGTSTTGTTSTPALSVSPVRARVLLGATQQFTASDPNVTWEVNHVPGGNDVLGTISSTGLYTAPAVVPIEPVVVLSIRSAVSNSGTNVSVNVGALTGNRFAYVSSASDNSIQIFAADSKTGTLRPTATFLVGTGKGPTSLAVSPNGEFLFSLNRGSNDISIFAINPATGDLTDAGTAPAPNGPDAMVFSSKGDFAYVGCDGASTIAAYAFSAGALTPLSSGSYAAGGGRIQSLALSADGKFLYAVNRDASEILGLAINQGDGSLSPIAGSPFSAQPGLSSIIVGSDWLGYTSHLYAGSDNGVEAYDRNPSSGALAYLPAATQTAAGKSPELFQNISDGLLIGVNPQSGGGFSFAFDYLGQPPGDLAPGGPPISTGASPVAGAWMWNDGGFINWMYVLNRQADASSTTGSIGVYQAGYTNGLRGPSVTIPIALHNPTRFVITP